MKICLISPGAFGFGTVPPLSLGYLASYINKYDDENHKIKILEESERIDLEKEIMGFNPDVIGIGMTSPQFPRSVKIADFIKENLDVPVVVGGVHPTVLPEQTLKGGKFDVGVIGEGEVTFFEIIQSLKNGSGLKHIKGTCYKEGKKIKLADPRPVLKNLDLLPPPARELINMNLYLESIRDVHIESIRKRSNHIFTSRGCPYNCMYCASFTIHKRGFRMHSPEYVLEEIRKLVKKYKPEVIRIMDDLFIVDKNRVRKICELLIESGLNEKVVFSAEMRANLVSKKDVEFMKLLKKAGVVQAEFGFESGSPRVLSYLKGGTVTIKQNHEAIEVCKEAGMRVFGNFMIGTLGETAENIKMTKRFILEHFDDLDAIVINLTTPYPGTELWELCEKKGLLKGVKWEELNWDFQYFNKKPRTYSDVLSQDELISFHRELSALAIKKMPLGLKIRKFLSDPSSNIRLLLPYLYYRLKGG